MGVVYLGRDLRRDMDVAIKFRGITHHDATLWIKREFRAVASLRHPNLVELYELVAHEQSCYFTMEYIPGVDPRDYAAKASAHATLSIDSSNTPTASAVPIQEARTETSVTPAPITQRAVPEVDFSRVRSVLAQLAEGLAFLHARGVIHRDVKPSNALVVDGNVKLLDFGLALERRRAAEELARETRIVGTAAYLAPEYVEKLTVSPAKGIYALGGARDGDTIAWRGRCHERERVPYRAFDFIIDDLATELAGNAALVAQLDHAGALARVFPPLGGVIEPMIGDSPPAEDLRVARERALLNMVALFRLVAETSVRGIVVIDDLQWADEDSLELLALLVERIARPLTIIATWTGELSPSMSALLARLGAASASTST